MTVFDNDRRTFTFRITSVERNFWAGRRFLAKHEMMDAIDQWKCSPSSPLLLENILCDVRGPAFKQVVAGAGSDLDALVSNLAEISYSYGIVYIGETPIYEKVIAVAETADHQTNIDAEVIDAIVQKLRGCGNDQSE